IKPNFSESYAPFRLNIPKEKPGLLAKEELGAVVVPREASLELLILLLKYKSTDPDNVKLESNLIYPFRLSIVNSKTTGKISFFICKKFKILIKHC
ncbi:MAG TPA: hypothetical protein PKD85_22245, partial [Saprospiraceae bacterium]|nr:hypothetical protein [Saprospiraceae bacterium]